ncbi:hypothetical protein OY671_011951, partial [Metschnikowia pulcherrima]
MPPQSRQMLNAPAFALTQIRLTVVSTVPKGVVHIDENTEVESRTEYEEPRSSRADVNYDDVGGMGDTIRQSRGMVESPSRYPESFTRSGVDPPKGVSSHGPPGTGKTEMASASAAGAASVSNWLSSFSAYRSASISSATAVYNVQPF